MSSTTFIDYSTPIVASWLNDVNKFTYTGTTQPNVTYSFGGTTIGYTDTNVISSFVSTVAGYNQVVLQNKSNATNASTNFNVSNNLGTATTNYGEFGINSSTFSGTGSFNQPGNVYLASASTDLVIGTYGANAIHFTVNSGATDAGSVSSAGVWTINYTQSGTGAVTRNLLTKVSEAVIVTDFGAKGDGVADDTAAIQAALNSGAKVVRGVQGATFLVSYANTRTVNSTAQRYCLLLPTGVLFDLDGSTIKLASAQNSSLFMSAASAADFGVVNGTLDSNKANQTTPATGDMAGIFLYAATRPRIESIKAINCRQYAGRFLDVTGGVFDRLHCTDSDGDGWSLGIDGGYTAHVRQAKIDNLSAESCLGIYGGGLQGNPVIFCVQDCVIGTVRGKDCAGGIKVQDSSSNTSIAAVEFDGASNGSANSGFKVQGNSGAAIYPSNIIVGVVSVRNAYGNGLYITSIESVSIGSYAGKNNGSGAGATGSDQYDTKIDSTNSFGRKSVQIGSIDIDTPKTTGINVTGTGHEQIGQWLVRNATGRGFLDSKSGGSLYVGPGKVIDDAATLTYAFQSSGAAKGILGPLDCTAAHSTSQSRVTIATANYDLSIGPVRLGNTDHLEGIVTLSNGATSTTVANGNVWKDYVGGASDYVCPAVRIEPINSSARALGVMYAVITDGSSGTGFSIKHSAAGATDKVRYSISGMSVWSVPAA